MIKGFHLSTLEGKGGPCTVVAAAFLSFFLFWAAAAAPPARCENKPRVLLLPFRVFAPEDKQGFLGQGLHSMFVSRLESEGLDLIPQEVSRRMLSTDELKGVSGEGRAEELGQEVQADYVIFGSVTALGGGYSLDLGILDLQKDPPELTRISEATNEEQLIPKLADVAYQFRAVVEGVDVRRYQAASPGGVLPEGEGSMGLFFRPTAESYGFQPSGYSTLRTAIVSLDTGDLNGDGKVEIVAVSRSRLLVTQREGDSLILKDQIEAGMGEEFLRVSTGDLDGDRKAEIYLVRLSGKRAQSTIYTWDGGFRKIGSYSGHLNVIKDQRAGRTMLLSLGSKLNKFFSGKIHRMEPGSNGSISKGEGLPLKGPQLYSLTLADLNRDGRMEFLGLDEKGYLTVWDAGGKALWEGNEKLGGSNNTVEVGNLPGPGDLPPIQEINGRVIVADVDKDGTREVIAAKNISIMDVLERLRVYKTSKLIAYKSEGTSLSQAWTTREIQYAVADIQEEGGTIYLGCQKGQFSKMSEGSSRIMWFE